MPFNKAYPFITVTMFLWLLAGLFTTTLAVEPYKVLVVMSYEENNPWCEEIKEGIESVLAENADLTYFYMDTKVNLKDGATKAKAAYAIFRKLQPHGVLTVDDNAQTMFVLPYLKEKVNTPVMFCGVNADAEKYGYPAANVSGILERGHIRESIAFLKQLAPAVQTVGFITKESPSGRALEKQVKLETKPLPAKIAPFEFVLNLKDLRAAVERLDNQCDALYLDSLEGILDEHSRPLNYKEIKRHIDGIFKKPIIGANRYYVVQGALCAVVKTGQEQGENAAEMLFEAMQGTPVKEIPIRRNYKGKRVINVTAMEQLGITPRPIVLLAAELVKTEE